MWLVFHYAFTVHKAEFIGDAITGALYYLIGSKLYVALPLTLVLLLSQQPRVAATDMAWPATPVRQLVAAVFWTPLLSPVIVVLTAGFKLSPLWSMSMWTLLPAMLLSPPAITITPWNGRKILALAMAGPSCRCSRRRRWPSSFIECNVLSQVHFMLSCWQSRWKKLGLLVPDNRFDLSMGSLTWLME